MPARPARPDRPIVSLGSFDAKYLEARKSLRMWPIPGPDLVGSAIAFIQDKLLLPTGRLSREQILVKTVLSPPNGDITDQVIVTFDSVRLRDEVKSSARNLRGTDRKVGVQIEAPDHLRSHYQVFQKLGYQIKAKHPALRRNVKFDDLDKSLAMDVKVSSDADWKTISYEDAKLLLKRSKHVPQSRIRQDELNSLVNLAVNNDAETVSDSDEDNFADAVVLPPDDENNTDKSYRPLSFINTNARSLAPKVESLFDCMFEKECDLGFVTETWFQDNRTYYDAVREYPSRFSLGIIQRNRSLCASNNRQYGGVAIFFRQKTSQLKEFQFDNPDEHEVVAAVGKVSGVKGKVFCVACYAPPNLAPSKAASLMEFISDVVSEGKRQFNNCSIVVCGDFNQWSTDCITQDHPEIKEVLHGPTRGNRSIDRSFVNFSKAVRESATLGPLETETGIKSDHRIAWARAVFEVEPNPTISYTYREYTEAGANAFVAALATQSWENVFLASTTSLKVKEFQKILDSNMNAYFRFKTVTRRENDPPWLNSKLKRMFRKRRLIYDREGRSNKWKAMKSESDEICRKRCKAFLDRQKQTMTAPDAARAFFRNVRAFDSKEKPKVFDVRDLFLSMQEKPTAEALADQFNAISNEFDGLLQDEIPPPAPNSLVTLSTADVLGRLKSFRKPKSMVLGDIFPCLVNRSATSLALPLTHIFNTITLTQSWPDLWKIEYVTPIPKKTMPQVPGDLRNISCTQLFSKIYESFVLQWLGEQVKLRPNQFGGVKGSGTEHFLVKLWQQVLENIEDPRAGSLLTSIDYAKAFNRLDFNHCLKCLKAKGADSNLTRIIASFLTGRVMRVKVGSAMSDPRQVQGESLRALS